jgi:hypothetical protein
MTAAVAPGGLMDTHITDGVKSAVLTAVDNILNEVRPRVQETVDDIFVSYRDCVLSERSEAELALEAHRSLLDTGLHTSVGTIMSDFQQFVDTTTSDNISKLEEAVRTATTAFDTRRTSIVESINAAHRASTLRPPTSTHVCLAQSPRTTSEDTPAAAQPPPPTGLELLLDNATPLGASRAAHASTAAYTPADLAHHEGTRLPTPLGASTAEGPRPPTPLGASRAAQASTAAYAPEDHAHHGGPRLPDRPFRTPPLNPYGPSDTRDYHHLRGAPNDDSFLAPGSRVRFNGEGSGRFGGAYPPHDFREFDSRDHAPSPSSGPRSPHGSDNSSNEYHRGQHGPDDCEMSALFLTNLGFLNEDIQHEIMRVIRHIHLDWFN